MVGLRFPLMVATALAGLVMLVNVTAYRQARVVSGATVMVDSTSFAALALVPVNSLASVPYSGAGAGTLRIDFRLGNSGTRTFFHEHLSGSPAVTVPGDLVKMHNIFKIKNNGSQSQCVSVFVSSGSPTNLEAIYGRITEVFPGTQLGGSLGVQTADRVNLTAGQELKVDFYWNATTNTIANVTGNFTIRVTGQNQVSCP
jgi:hypothetical protein